MKLTLFWVHVFFCFTTLNSIQAQNEIGISSSFKWGRLVDHSEVDFFESNSTISFGIFHRKYIAQSFFWNNSILYQNVGLKTLNIRTNDEIINFYWKANSITYSSDFGYYFIKGKKFKIGLSIGLKLAIALNEETQIVQTQIEEGYVDIGHRIGLLPSLENNIDFCFTISDAINLCLRPNWSHFLYPGIQSQGYQGRNVGCDLIVLYSI